MSAIVEIRVAYACKCIYSLCDNHPYLYSEIFLRYAREGLIVHLDVLIAKRKDQVVCACLVCLFKVYKKMCILPEIPKDFPYVCVMFFKRSANIDYMFDARHEKDDEANNNPAIIFMYINRWLNNVFNPFMTHLLISLKHFFIPFIPDEYLQVEKIFGRYQSKRIRQKQRILSGGRTFISSPYSNFLYEMSLYADIPVSKIEKLF